MTNIKNMYTEVMHKAIQNALRTGNYLEYNLKNTGNGELINFIRARKDGVTFYYNTCLTMVAANTKESFLNFDYEYIISKLEEIYNKTQSDSMYQLRSEYYQLY